jgi:IS1 family transposase
MASNPLLYQLLLVALVCLCFVLHALWPDERTGVRPTLRQPRPPRPKRSREPKPFAGLIHNPRCAACEQAAESGYKAPRTPPPLITSARGRKHTMDSQAQFCPDVDCSYDGWLGRGNIRANGHPGGNPWRQFQCVSCLGYFHQLHGTPLHGKHVSPDTLVWAVTALAEGLGIRAVARVFEVDPNTVLQWLLEAAEHLQAFSRYCLRDVHVEQVQRDELFAWLSAVKDGDIRETQALKRLSRSPHGVGVAMDPVSKLILAIDVGDRTLALAQRLVHQVAQVLVPDCAPLFLTDGFREYLTALVTHYGQWMPPERRQAQGPMPKPRWMPRPELLYAQVVKAYRRRRIVGVKHHVVFGTLKTVQEVLAKRGWQINTAFVERLNLDFRQHMAALGRRVNTRCTHEAGLRQQLALFQVYHNFVLPHANLRQALTEPVPTNGTGSAKRWRPCTPAMAAGLTDRVWRLRDVVLFRVPPWPQPQSV